MSTTVNLGRVTADATEKTKIDKDSSEIKPNLVAPDIEITLTHEETQEIIGILNSDIVEKAEEIGSLSIAYYDEEFLNEV